MVDRAAPRAELQPRVDPLVAIPAHATAWDNLRPVVGRAFCATTTIATLAPAPVGRASCATSTIALAPKAQATRA